MPMLSPVQQEFVRTELGRGHAAYERRLEFIGLVGHERILDAGGGIGQWAIPLAARSERVDVLDLSSERLLIGYRLATSQGISNIHYRYGKLESLPYEDNSFDAILCYSVFMFADGPKALSEFHRVLKSQGRVYVMIDLWRWYIDLMRSRTVSNRWRLAFLAKLLMGRGPTLYTTRSFAKLLRRSGFEIVEQGPEGTASFEAKSSDCTQLPFYPQYPVQTPRLWEACARKRHP